MEEFRPIAGFEGKYLVSNLGNVKSVCTYHKRGERILKQYNHIDSDYVFVMLANGRKVSNGKSRTTYKNFDVHRLVAETFIPNPDGLPYVNHKDENKKNNAADNLEWCTAKYNANYGTIKERVCKKVNQYSESGELLNTYDSVHGAAAAVGGYAGNISSCCNGRLKRAYGFIWRHATKGA